MGVKPGRSVAQLAKQDAVEKGTTPAYLQASSNFQTSGWNNGLDHGWDLASKCF